MDFGRTWGAAFARYLRSPPPLLSFSHAHSGCTSVAVACLILALERDFMRYIPPSPFLSIAFCFPLSRTLRLYLF